MTHFELNQPEEILIDAGRIAYMIGIPNAANPYRRNQLLFKLWNIGFKQAKYSDDRTRLHGKYKVHFEPIVTNPPCNKCGIPVDTYCTNCGDMYESTETE